MIGKFLRKVIFGVSTIDLLHTDEEGYDWKVRLQLDLERFKPTFIPYEHHHLEPGKRKAALAYLLTDYDVFRGVIDWMAIRKDVGRTRTARLTKQFTRASA